LRFHGQAGVTVPPGGEYVSDPIDWKSNRADHLAVSLFVRALPKQQSAHLAAHATQFIVPGDQSSNIDLKDGRKVASWYQVSGIEVETEPQPSVVVAIGDSITDGSGSTMDGNDRWTDFLIDRLAQDGGAATAVVNAGIGGNCLLRECTGPRLLDRFDRDVLKRPGVTHAIVLIGVNDLGRLHRGQNETPASRAVLVAALESGWRDLVQRAHKQGVCLIAGTLTPYGASTLYKPRPENEADRQEINGWIRTSGLFDGVADFDAAVRDPSAPDQLQSAFDSGDHLHLSPAGYRAMAGAVPLDRIATCAAD
jgi:lysophospholipase L1-like esterase